MKIYRLITAVLFFMIFTDKTGAQANFHIGTSIPVADFASGNFNHPDAGGATIGPAVGLQFHHPVKNGVLGLYGGIDLTYNWIQKAMKDSIAEIFGQMGFSDVTLKYSKYMNIPISGGITFRIEDEDDITIFGNLGLVIDVINITDMEIAVGYMTFIQSCKPDVHAGMNVGAGILFNDKILLKVDYLSLGEHDLKEALNGPGVEEEFIGYQKVSMMNLTLGFVF